MNRDELVRRACQGDQAARNAVGKWLQAELRSFFISKRVSGQDLEDVVQDTMVDIWTKAHHESHQDADRFLAWVRRFAGMATIKATGEQKRDYKFARHIEEAMPEPEPPPLQHSAIREQRERELLREWAPKLPTIYRTALQLWLDEGDVAAMAEREGIDAVSMRGRMFKAREKVKQMIEDARKTPLHLR